MYTRLFIAVSVSFACATGVKVAGAQTALPPHIAEFVENHCSECHSNVDPEASLDLTTISHDLLDPAAKNQWIQVFDRVSADEMPPASAAQPASELKKRFLHSLGISIHQADVLNREVALRRLNRAEYENTVRDLFGIHVNVQDVLPDDSNEQTFDTLAADQSVSAELMVAYLEAADLVLDKVFGSDREPRRVRETVNIKDLSSKTTADQLTDDGAILFSGAKELPLYGISVYEPGLYRLRIQAKAIQSDRPVVMQVNGGVTGRMPGHVAGFVQVVPDDWNTIEITDRAVESYDTFSFKLIGGFPWWSVGEDYAGAGILLGDIEVEGPLEEWPPASRRQLLGDVDPAVGNLEDIRSILRRIVPQAFRRATTEDEVEPFVELARHALEGGLSFELALRRALKGVLCAPEFLFLDEPPETTGDDSDETQTISDFALASRLSYFLWRSLPDDQLLQLAERNELHRPEILRAEVERLLSDPKSQRFVESFTGQWLRLDDIDFTVPDENLYPEYNQLLRQSMLDESCAFFRELLDKDLSVQNFIDSDFLMINEPLADFYGIDGVDGLQIRRVELPDQSVRGGVLTQASVLKVSADGTRTSPVLRGAWILKNFYGTPSPPPPPTVSAVEPDIRGATTIRELLAKHRDHDSCNYCHRKIDPPGFALESFDVIGAQREWYRTRESGEEVQVPRHPQAPTHFVQYRKGPAIDSSGVTVDGQPFTDIRQYKRLLLEDRTALVESLTRLLLTYSIGRPMGFSDRPEIERIVANVESNDAGLRSLILEIVTSETFRAIGVAEK